jgi:soluble lytic murein transglycosylase
MSTARSATRGARGPTRAQARRRRLLWIAIAVGLGVAVAVGISRVDVEKALREITLPLRHDDIIRQQAADKDLDPAMIAAVIYAESRFQD